MAFLVPKPLTGQVSGSLPSTNTILLLYKRLSGKSDTQSSQWVHTCKKHYYTLPSFMTYEHCWCADAVTNLKKALMLHKQNINLQRDLLLTFRILGDFTPHTTLTTSLLTNTNLQLRSSPPAANSFGSRGAKYSRNKCLKQQLLYGENTCTHSQLHKP